MFAARVDPVLRGLESNLTGAGGVGGLIISISCSKELDPRYDSYTTNWIRRTLRRYRDKAGKNTVKFNAFLPQSLTH